MGDVVSLSEYRADRERGAGAFGRLDRAVQRLDPLVRARLDRLSPTIQRELVAIARAVSAGGPPGRPSVPNGWRASSNTQPRRVEQLPARAGVRLTLARPDAGRSDPHGAHPRGDRVRGRPRRRIDRRHARHAAGRLGSEPARPEPVAAATSAANPAGTGTPEAWLAWVPGGLPDGFGASITAIPGIVNTTTATADIAWLTGSSDARGDPSTNRSLRT